MRIRRPPQGRSFLSSDICLISIITWLLSGFMSQGVWRRHLDEHPHLRMTMLDILATFQSLRTLSSSLYSTMLQEGWTTSWQLWINCFPFTQRRKTSVMTLPQSALGLNLPSLTTMPLATRLLQPRIYWMQKSSVQSICFFRSRKSHNCKINMSASQFYRFYYA